MHQEKVFLHVTSSSFTADLPHALFWNKCYLESTNLKSTAAEDTVAVKVFIDKITNTCVLTSESHVSQEMVSFFITDDDSTSIHPSHRVIINGDPDLPLHRLKVEVTGLGGGVLQTPGFMVLRFECN